MNAFAAERCTGILADYADRLLIGEGESSIPRASPAAGTLKASCSASRRAQPTGTDNLSTSTGPSADTVIAERLEPERCHPLTLYSGMKGGYIDEKLSFSAAGQVRAAEGNPYNVYQRLVGLLDPGTGEPTPMADQLALRRNSVNDLIREQINASEGRAELSNADRDRLDRISPPFATWKPP